MRTIPPALQTKLDSGVTTLCRCWIVTRRDGVVQGFTDHDEDVVLGDVTCRAGTGLSGSEASAQLGLAVQGMELAGALSDATLNEADLAAGRYDAAAIEVHLVDWSEPSLGVLLGKGVLGEVRREGAAFTAELRSLAHRLAEDKGRLYTATCSADLGDARCAVDLTAAEFRGSGAVASLAGASIFRASGLDDFDDGWFTALPRNRLPSAKSAACACSAAISGATSSARCCPSASNVTTTSAPCCNAKSIPVCSAAPWPRLTG